MTCSLQPHMLNTRDACTLASSHGNSKHHWNKFYTLSGFHTHNVFIHAGGQNWIEAGLVYYISHHLQEMIGHVHL